MGDASNVAAGAYSNSVTPSDRLQGPAAPASYGSGYAGPVANAAGGIASAYAQYSAGQANKRLARQNARMANEQADQAIQTGKFQANRVGQQERIIEGAQKASAASQGVVVGAGTQHHLAEASQAASEMDQRMIELNARREAYGFRARAAIDTFQGKQAARAGTMAATETALNTGSKLWQQVDANHRIEWGH